MSLHDAVRTLATAVWNDLPTIYRGATFNVPPRDLKGTTGHLVDYIRHNYYTMLSGTAAAAPLPRTSYDPYLRRFAALNLVLDDKKDTVDSRAWITELAGGTARAEWNTSFFYLDNGVMDIHRRYYIHARPDRVTDVMAALHDWWRGLPSGALNAKAVGPAEANRVDCIVVYAAKTVSDGDVVRTVPGDALLDSTLPATVRVTGGISRAPGIKESWGEAVSSSIAEAAVEKIMCDRNKIDQLDKESFDEVFPSLEKRRTSIEAEKRSGDDALHIQLQHFDKMLTFGSPQDRVFKFLTPDFMRNNRDPFLAAVAEAIRAYNADPVTLDKTVSEKAETLDEEEGTSATRRPVEFLAKTRRAIFSPFAKKPKGKMSQPMVEMSPDRQARAAPKPTPVSNSAPLFAPATSGLSEKERALIRSIQNSLEDTPSRLPTGGVPLHYPSATTASGPSAPPRFPPPRSTKGATGATTTTTSSGSTTASAPVARTPPPRPARSTPPPRQHTHNPTIDALQRDALINELQRKLSKGK